MAFKTDQEVEDYVKESGKASLHEMILNDNAQTLDQAMNFADTLIEHFKARGIHPFLFGYGALIASIHVIHANRELVPKQLFLHSVEALYDNYDQYIKEEQAGLSQTQGNA